MAVGVDRGGGGADAGAVGEVGAQRVEQVAGGADGLVDQALQRGPVAREQEPPGAGAELVRGLFELERNGREPQRCGEVVLDGREAGVRAGGRAGAGRGGPGSAPRRGRRGRRRASRGAPGRSARARGRWPAGRPRAPAPCVRSAPRLCARWRTSSSAPAAMSSNSSAVARRRVTCASRSVTAVSVASAASSRISCASADGGASSSATWPSVSSPERIGTSATGRAARRSAGATTSMSGSVIRTVPLQVLGGELRDARDAAARQDGVDHPEVDLPQPPTPPAAASADIWASCASRASGGHGEPALDRGRVHEQVEHRAVRVDRVGELAVALRRLGADRRDVEADAGEPGARLVVQAEEAVQVEVALGARPPARRAGCRASPPRTGR